MIIPTYLTPEKVAQQLKVYADDNSSTREKLKAIRIGGNIRIHETELEQLLVTSAAVPSLTGVGLQRPMTLHLCPMVRDGARLEQGEQNSG